MSFIFVYVRYSGIDIPSSSKEFCSSTEAECVRECVMAISDVLDTSKRLSRKRFGVRSSKLNTTFADFTRSVCADLFQFRSKLSSMASCI